MSQDARRSERARRIAGREIEAGEKETRAASMRVGKTPRRAPTPSHAYGRAREDQPSRARKSARLAETTTKVRLTSAVSRCGRIPDSRRPGLQGALATARAGARRRMADQQKFRVLYGKAGVLLERWTAAQSRASALFSSAASVVERLPLLADDARFGPLARRFPNLPSRARDAQAEALGRVLDALEVELALFRELVGAMEKLHRDGSQLVSASGPAAAGAARLGPAPSLAEATTGLHDLWRLHRDESALKDALARELTCDASPEDLASARAIFDAEPNLDPNHVREIVERVPVRAADGPPRGGDDPRDAES